MIRTIIVEDDPMVAQINRQYLCQLGGFSVEAICAGGLEAWSFLLANEVDLLILDIYMPGMDGCTLLRKMRAAGMACSVIMVTAATEVAMVEEVLSLGIEDYLIKPYSFERFRDALHKYRHNAELLQKLDTVNQDVMDELLVHQNRNDTAGAELRKGLNQNTLRTILGYLEEAPDDEHTCESISQHAGLSKVTVRRYLNYLIEIGELTSAIDYETGGRPRVLYRRREQREDSWRA